MSGFDHQEMAANNLRNMNMQMNAGGGGMSNAKAYPGLLTIGGVGENGIADALMRGAESGALNPFQSFGGKGVFDMLSGAGDRNSPFAKIFGQMFNKEGAKMLDSSGGAHAFTAHGADAGGAGGGDASGGGGGGDSGSNHAFSAVGSAAQDFAAEAQFAGNLAAGAQVSPSATAGKGQSQDAGMGM